MSGAGGAGRSPGKTLRPSAACSPRRPPEGAQGRPQQQPREGRRRHRHPRPPALTGTRPPQGPTRNHVGGPAGQRRDGSRGGTRRRRRKGGAPWPRACARDARAGQDCRALQGCVFLAPRPEGALLLSACCGSPRFRERTLPMPRGTRPLAWQLAFSPCAWGAPALGCPGWHNCTRRVAGRGCCSSGTKGKQAALQLPLCHAHLSPSYGHS